MDTDPGWMITGGHLFGVVDVELTNRCNAHCSFCPRDLTPHQGVMTPAVFERVLARVLEFRDACGPVLPKAPNVSFCGLGEQLLNRDVTGFVGQLRDGGIDSVVNTNAALLDEDRGRALLDAGVEAVMINGGELGDDYERTYRLPFGRTRDNVARFVELAADRCRVFIVLVDHGDDAGHVDEVEAYWRGLGVTRFFRLDLLNRAGSLPVPSMHYDAERPGRAEQLWGDETGHAACDAPFHFPFIGYDGQYYLCSSDWQKEVAFGTVFETSIVDIMAAKLERVTSRSPICRACNHDPLNRLSDRVAAVERGEADEVDLVALTEELRGRADNLAEVLGRLGVPTRADGVSAAAGASAGQVPDGREQVPTGHRQLIPVVAR